MKKIGFSSVLLSLFATGAVVIAKPIVAVSIPPQKFVFDAVAGERAPSCLVMVDRGQDPHVFEPTPKQLSALQGCELYFKVGLPFEAVLVKKLTKINPSLRVVEVPSVVRGVHHEHEDEHRDHEHAEDPHCWMSPDWLVLLSQEMASVLVLQSPEAAGEIVFRQQAFAERVVTLKRALAERLTAAGVTHVLVYHPAWGHFAEAFGLEQVAVEAHGQTPGARHLSTVSATIREHGLKTMLVQNASERRRIAAFAKRRGLRTAVVYPLGEDVFEILTATVDAVTGTGEVIGDR